MIFEYIKLQIYNFYVLYDFQLFSVKMRWHTWNVDLQTHQHVKILMWSITSLIIPHIVLRVASVQMDMY